MLQQGAMWIMLNTFISISEPDLKKRIRVHLLNAHGLDEAGIDGGGIFREFLNELLKSGFNPNQGFFKTTNEGLLYPSPTAEMLVGESFTRHYYFLGRILGKVRQGSHNVLHYTLTFLFLQWHRASQDQFSLLLYLFTIYLNYLTVN